MSGWLECEIAGELVTEAELLISVEIYDDGDGINFFIPKGSEDIKKGSDGVALLRVELGKADKKWGATRVWLPAQARIKQKVWWVRSCQLRTKFKELK